jgi:hypothetical protein
MGPQGPAGPAGVTGRTVKTRTVDLPANAHTLIDITCDPGSVPIAGGGHIGTSFSGWGDAKIAYIAESDIDLAGTGWQITAVTTQSADPSTSFVAHVICIVAAE